MESSGGPHDPWQWIQLAAAGFLGAVGKRLWEVLRGTSRPEGGEHSNAYMGEQLRELIERMDRMEAKVDRHSRILERMAGASGD